MLYDIFSSLITATAQKIVAAALVISSLLGFGAAPLPTHDSSPSRSETAAIISTTTASVSDIEQEASAMPESETPHDTIDTLEADTAASDSDGAMQTTSAGAIGTTPPQPPAPASAPTISIPELNTTVRNAVVNIFCISKSGGVFAPISGSGVFIDPRGVIITNAHIAQYLLLRDYDTKDFIECTVRQGSPAMPLYKAELLYVPPAWVRENAQNIIVDKPMGTGENDFAFLVVTEPAGSAGVLPQTFPFIEPAPLEERPVAGLGVLIAGYPAGFLGGLDIARSLWLVSSTAAVQQILTFKDAPPYTPDEFSVGGTVIAQQGVSGGAVVNIADGKLLGIFVTSILEGTTDKRDLRALSLFHINEALKRYTGENV
ncbi:MAG: serine protease, partial [Patescibacteria group bacterium]